MNVLIYLSQRMSLLLLFICSAQTVSFSQIKNGDPMRELIEKNMQLAAVQYREMAKNIAQDRTPHSFADGKWINQDIKWWCSGFYAGNLWYIYEYTGDTLIKLEAEKALKIIEPNQTYTGHHDLGFMMYCSFGNAYRITGKPVYKEIVLKSAESLATRYRPKMKSIQSWNKNKYWNSPVIIDNLMNLELLNWAGLMSNNDQLRKISNSHALTTLKNHFRSDNSSYHVVDYDEKTGKVIRKATWQGAADCSSWSRGQGWALYGYTMMYRFTKDKRYLKQAKRIANFILNHPNLPADKIPYWDFDAPRIPFAPKDASAGAIITSALLELSQYATGRQKIEYLTASETMLKSLSGDGYRSKLGENGGFLLRHSTGAHPFNSEIDVPLIYADYYYLEALTRYHKLYLHNSSMNSKG